MNRKKPKWLRVVITVMVIAALAAAAWLLFFNRKEPENTPSYTSSQVKKSTIEQTVIGTGTVQAEETETLTARVDGTLESLNVKDGSAVKKGDVLAVIRNETVVQSVKQLETELLKLDLTLSNFSRGTADDKIKAPADGRIKMLNVKEGDDVALAVKKFGMLAALSTDGKMKVLVDALKPTSVKTGDTVDVKISGKTGGKGTVEEVLKQGALFTVVIGKDTYPAGAAAVVSLPSGEVLGEGKLEINKPLPITAVGGTVKKLYVKENELVDRKDTLIRLDDEPLSAEFETQRIAREQKATELDDAREKMENLIVTAPSDGVIADIQIKEGDTVAVGDTIATLLGGSSFDIVVGIDELDVANLKEGQTAKVTVDALPGKNFDAMVDLISLVGATSNNVTSYDVTLKMSKSEGLRIGMSASAEILVLKKENVLVVPIEAVQTIGKEKFVMVTAEDLSSNMRRLPNETGTPQTSGSAGRNAQGGADRMAQYFSAQGNAASGLKFDPTKVQMRPVKTGLANDSEIEITKGLNEGETILILDTSGNSNIMNMFMMGGSQPRAQRSENQGTRQGG